MYGVKINWGKDVILVCKSLVIVGNFNCNLVFIFEEWDSLLKDMFNNFGLYNGFVSEFMDLIDLIDLIDFIDLVGEVVLISVI